MEMVGNQEIIIDGCKGILEYDDGNIRINANKIVINVSGGGLTLTSMNDESLIIKGRINRIDFTG